MDTYIDVDEVQKYGPNASAKIRTEVAALDPAFAPGMKSLADRIDAQTAEVGRKVAESRAAASKQRGGVQQKIPALARTREVIGRFSKHLDSHEGGEVDRKRFFAADGTVAGIGEGGHDTLLGARHIEAELKKKDAGVKDPAYWHKQVATAADDLAAALTTTEQGRVAKVKMTPELRASRAAWLATYRAARAVVEGVLRLHDQLHLLPEIFRDLAVPTPRPAAPPAPAP